MSARHIAFLGMHSSRCHIQQKGISTFYAHQQKLLVLVMKLDRTDHGEFWVGQLTESTLFPRFTRLVQFFHHTSVADCCTDFWGTQKQLTSAVQSVICPLLQLRGALKPSVLATAALPSLGRGVSDSTLASVCYTVFIQTLTTP